MRITIVLNTSWNLYNFRRGLIDALGREGHTVTLIAPEDEYTNKLRALGYRVVTVDMDRRGINPRHDLVCLRQLYRLYRQLRPDVTLHFTVKPNVYGTLAASWLGVPSINTVSGLGTVFLKAGPVSWIAQQLYRMAFRWPQHVFFHNQDDCQLFVDRRLVAAPRAAVIPGSGVDVQRFSPAKSAPPQEFTFLVIARLLYDKGIVEYAEAARALRARGVVARFQLLGARDPQHRRSVPNALIDAWIEEQIIDYLGTTDDVRPHIRRADVVVLPSYREGLPRTLLEASSMGKPIVATDAPGCRHVVSDGDSGLLCRVRDATDLANTMQRLMRLSAEQRQAMGQRGRAIVEERFSEKHVVDQYLLALAQIGQRNALAPF